MKCEISSKWPNSRNSYTVSFWIKPAAIDQRASYVVSKNRGGNHQWTFNNWYRTNSGISNMQVTTAWGNSTGLNSNDLGFSQKLLVDVGEWNHFAVVTTSNSSRFYISGNQVASAGSFEWRDTSGGSLRFGNTNGNANQFFGALDDVRIYDRPLTEQEIEALAADHN